MNELPKVIKRSHAKRNLIAKIKFLNELSYCVMDGNDINEVSEKVDQAIKCAKKRLNPSGDGLIIQQKQKKTRSSSRIFCEKSTNL